MSNKSGHQSKQTMRSLLKFFSLTYIVSWILWIAAAAILRVPSPQPSGFLVLSGLLYLLGVFAPSLVALALTARADGQIGVRREAGRRFGIAERRDQET
jgi:hypothetical protein